MVYDGTTLPWIGALSDRWRTLHRRWNVIIDDDSEVNILRYCPDGSCSQILQDGGS